MTARITKLIACLCTVLCLLGTLSACAAEKYDLLHTQTVGSLTYCVRGNRFRAKQLVIKSGEEIVFHEKVKVSKDVGSFGGTYGLSVSDLNFDGNPDVMIADGIAGDCVSYICWLWNANTNTFVRSEELTGLCNIKADEDLHAVFGFEHTFETEQAYADAPEATISSDIATKYEWKDGKLLPQTRVSITFYSESNLYCYSVSYYDAESGSFSDSDDKWLTPEEYAKQDMSFLYYFK